MLSFESYTASLKSKSDAIDGVLGQADDAFAGFDRTMSKINNAIPGFADGKAEGAVREAEVASGNSPTPTSRSRRPSWRKDGGIMAMLSEGANNFSRKIDPLFRRPARRPPAEAAINPLRSAENQRGPCALTVFVLFRQRLFSCRMEPLLAKRLSWLGRNQQVPSLRHRFASRSRLRLAKLRSSSRLGSAGTRWGTS